MTVSLAELKILALDCQATGANPPKGHLLELGWMSACASHIKKSQATGVQAYLSRLPMDEKIPRAVSRITGISDDSLTAAKTSRNIWQQLMEAVKEVISENQMAICPTVIHFARFEEPFLKDLHHKNDPERRPRDLQGRSLRSSEKSISLAAVDRAWRNALAPEDGSG